MDPRARTSPIASCPSSRSDRRSARRVACRRLLPVSNLTLADCGRAASPDIHLETIKSLRLVNLGALSRDGVLYVAAMVHMPETRPAHFSLFTARLPSKHGSLSITTPLGEEALTLAEVLASAGYDTAGFVGCVLLDDESGAQQGFAAFDAGDRLMRPAGEVIADA